MIWLYIIILRSDNRMEYKEGRLQDYLSDHGIIHQIRCVNPHAQNGVAKWDKQHILEVARSIMFIPQVPKAYWGDALLLTAYLINLLPFKALNFNTPLELLQGTSSYLVAPKVRFYVLHPNHRPTLSKQDHRQKQKCVFVAYSAAQKGYKCYHLPSMRFFISMASLFERLKAVLSSQRHLFKWRIWILKNLWYFSRLKLWMKMRLK